MSDVRREIKQLYDDLEVSHPDMVNLQASKEIVQLALDMMDGKVAPKPANVAKEQSGNKH